MDRPSQDNSSKKYSVLKNIFNKDFVISAVTPIIIFTFFDNLGMTFDGIILSGGWSIGVICVNFIKERIISALASISAIVAVIGLIGTIISKNAAFYLISPIIQDILIVFMLFGSLFLERPLIQVIVEQSYLKNISKERRKQPEYKKVWRIITIAWGVLGISQAVVRIILLYTVSMSSYYAISTVYGNVSTPLMIAFSIMLPKWYWRRKK